MSSIRGRDTRPELTVRKYLWHQGFRFRLHARELSGRPDLVLARFRTVILVHGCFWHQHRGCPYVKTVSSNAERWTSKLTANVARDNRTIESLQRDGWSVIIIWECGLRRITDVERALDWLPARIRAGERTTLTMEWPLLR